MARDQNSLLCRGHGRGRNIIPHVSGHESPIQEENRGYHREQQVHFEEVSLRLIMRSILECLPLLKDIDQEGSHHSRDETR